MKAGLQKAFSVKSLSTEHNRPVEGGIALIFMAVHRKCFSELPVFPPLHEVVQALHVALLASLFVKL